MNPKKRAKLEANGWRIGNADDFLELTPEESALVELQRGYAELGQAQRENLEMYPPDTTDGLDIEDTQAGR